MLCAASRMVLDTEKKAEYTNERLDHGVSNDMNTWRPRWLKELWPLLLPPVFIALGVLVYKDHQNAASSTSFERMCLNSCKPLSSRVDKEFFKPAPGMSIDLDNPKKVECFCGDDTVGTRLH